MLTTESIDLLENYSPGSDISSMIHSPIIRKLYNSLIRTKYTNSKISYSDEPRKYPHSDFLAPSLQAKVEKRSDVRTVIWTTRGKYSVKNTLHVYMIPGSGEPNIELLIKAISFITSFSDRARTITVNLCLLPDKKILRKGQKKISKLNVNSGSNHFSETESDICVFRKEEAIKVIIHEVIHGLRFSQLESDEEISEKLCVKYDLDSRDILIDESYTEIWAQIFNCLFVSTLTDSVNKYQDFVSLLAIERNFAIYQGAKIEQFARDSIYKNIDKETNVTAYYLLVGEIYMELEAFLTKCGHRPYIKDKGKCLSFIRDLPKIPKRRVSVKDEFYSTMRMSAVELEL